MHQGLFNLAKTIEYALSTGLFLLSVEVKRVSYSYFYHHYHPLAVLIQFIKLDVTWLKYEANQEGRQEKMIKTDSTKFQRSGTRNQLQKDILNRLKSGVRQLTSNF